MNTFFIKVAEHQKLALTYSVPLQIWPCVISCGNTAENKASHFVSLTVVA